MLNLIYNHVHVKCISKSKTIQEEVLFFIFNLVYYQEITCNLQWIVCGDSNGQTNRTKRAIRTVPFCLPIGNRFLSHQKDHKFREQKQSKKKKKNQKDHKRKRKIIYIWGKKRNLCQMQTKHVLFFSTLMFCMCQDMYLLFTTWKCPKIVNSPFLIAE